MFNRGASTVGTITVTPFATSYTTISDRRLKTNIQLAGEVGDLFDQIEVREFEFLAQPGVTRIGFIAQELHPLFPDAVSAGDDGETIERTWSVDPAKLVPLLVREVQSLRARVAQLETT